MYFTYWPRTAKIEAMQVHKSQIPDKKTDKKIYELVKKHGSARKVAKSGEVDLGKSVIAKRNRRYKQYLDREYEYPDI